MAGSFSGSVTGYVAKDPEPKANGKAVGFSIPVSKGKDKPTTWVRVTAWGKTAEFVSQYIHKGSLVTASGDIELREFDGKNGKQQSLELNAQSVQSFKTDGGAPRPAPRATEPDDGDVPF
jgi:single-strand DNA-binding protein